MPGDSPCGASVQVLVPLGTLLQHSAAFAAGTAASATTATSGTPATARTDPAEHGGHGLLPDRDLRGLLGSAPVLRAVWVDEHGLPVAVGDRAERPGRDPGGVGEALQQLLDRPPPRLHPRHPDDHDATGQSRAGAAPSEPDPDESWLEQALADALQHVPDPWPHWHRADRPPDRPPTSRMRPRLREHHHPTEAPGSYAPGADLRRLVLSRSPRCEWPGCGARSSRCDVDHDTAWPSGPTCACNLGPLCRHHHRLKQQQLGQDRDASTGWLKHRQDDGSVRWTSPTGHTWTSPPQHEPNPGPG